MRSIGVVAPTASAGALLAAIAALIGSAACEGGEGHARRPNVMLVVFDTTRADDMSIFETDRNITPTVDAIAAGGLRFRDAWSLYSVTVPSHVSLFTGHVALAPVEHAIAAEEAGASAEAPSDQRFDYRRSSLFTILRDHGYRTYAFAGNDNVHPDKIEALAAADVIWQIRPEPEARQHWKRMLELYGESQSFSELPTASDWNARRRSRPIIVNDAGWVSRQALSAMRDHAANHPDTPYFLFLNYNDAHDPYFPEPPFDARVPSPPESRFNGNLWNRFQRRGPTSERGLALSMTAKGLSPADIERARALHLGSIAQADHRFGELLEQLEALGLLEASVIVIASDHGEAFGEGGRMAHGGWGDEDVVRALLHVPLVMRFPDATIEPAIIEQRVDLRDVKPTLLDYLEIEDDSSQGRSLLPLIRRQSTSLRASEPRPQDDDTRRVGDNLIGGQSEEATEKLRKELRTLGYIE